MFAMFSPLPEVAVRLKTRYGDCLHYGARWLLRALLRYYNRMAPTVRFGARYQHHASAI